MKDSVIGIDVGTSGAIAFMGLEGDRPGVEDFPDSPAACAELLRPQVEMIRHAFIERVQAMPKWGRSSCFNFGRSLGEWIGVLAALQIPFTLVEPSKWKKHYNISGPDKDKGRQRAIQLFPAAAADLARKKDHNRADALLIANYGRTLLH